jgi:hypothetical protein
VEVGSVELVVEKELLILVLVTDTKVDDVETEFDTLELLRVELLVLDADVLERLELLDELELLGVEDDVLETVGLLEIEEVDEVEVLVELGDVVVGIEDVDDVLAELLVVVL